MTNKKSPNVKIVTGNVKITNIGLIKIFNKPSTIATNKAVVNVATCTPGIMLAIIITKIAVTKILISNFIYDFLIFINVTK